jgi:hypothetical protein
MISQHFYFEELLLKVAKQEFSLSEEEIEVHYYYQSIKINLN